MIIVVAAVVILLIGLELALFIGEHNVPDDMHWSGKAVLLPWWWIGFGLDIALNAFVASIVFLGPPRELTISARVRRLKKGEPGYRRRLAIWICRAYLRPVDDGHC